MAKPEVAITRSAELRRSEEFGAWLSDQLAVRDLTSGKIERRLKRRGYRLSRQHIDYLVAGHGSHGEPNRPKQESLRALALGLATRERRDGTLVTDEAERELLYLQMVRFWGYLLSDDPEAIKERDQLIEEARQHGVTVVLSRTDELVGWTRRATDDLRRKVQEEIEQRRRSET